MSFEFTETTAAVLTSITPRTETHGDDEVFAASFGLKLTGPNTLLDKLSPTLRQALYKPADEATDTLPDIEQATPVLRATGIELMTLKGALQGWTIEIDHGLDETDPIKIGDCKVDALRVHPMQGGSVHLMFRVGSNDIDATEAGLLCSHLKQEIAFRLTAPVKVPGTTEATGAAIDGSVGHPGAAAGQGSLLDGDAAAEGAGDGLGGFDDDMARGDDVAEQADLEAGMAEPLAAAGVAPKGARRGRNVAAH